MASLCKRARLGAKVLKLILWHVQARAAPPRVPPCEAGRIHDTQAQARCRRPAAARLAGRTAGSLPQSQHSRCPALGIAPVSAASSRPQGNDPRRLHGVPANGMRETRRTLMDPRRAERRCPLSGASRFAQSSRWTRSFRSCRSCASRERVAIGRASRRFREMGSPVSSQ